MEKNMEMPFKKLGIKLLYDPTVVKNLPANAGDAGDVGKWLS